MSIIEWDDETFLLGIPAMDVTHREFIKLVNLLSESPDSDYPRLFEQLIEHTEKHFLQEEELMKTSSFPAYGEHRDEHQRILGELNQFRKRVNNGLVAFGRNYINQRIPDWFRLHAATMDSALAMHLKTFASDHAGELNQHKVE